MISNPHEMTRSLFIASKKSVVKDREIYDRQARERQQTTLKQNATVMEYFPQRADKGTARDQAGNALGISGKTVDFATKVIKDGTPELVAAGTATVTRVIAERHNETAAPLDRVTGMALQFRIRNNEGKRKIANGNNSEPTAGRREREPDETETFLKEVGTVYYARIFNSLFRLIR